VGQELGISYNYKRQTHPSFLRKQSDKDIDIKRRHFMKPTIVSAILLILLTVLVGCTGLPPLPGQTGASNPAEQEASARATFIAERGGGDMMVTQGDGGDGMMFNGTVGTISAIEPEAQRITLSAPDGTETTVAVAEGGTITQQSEGARDDLKEGEQVTVLGDAEGAAMMVQLGAGGMTIGAIQRPLTVPAGGNAATTPIQIHPINGTVLGLDGSTLTLTPTDGGEVVTVQLTEQTRIEKNEVVEFAVLEIGMTVSAMGDPDADGTVQAQYLMILPEGIMTMPGN
jgi:hypothetical protein